MKTISFSLIVFLGFFASTAMAQMVTPRVVHPSQMNPHNSQKTGFSITPAAGAVEFITKKLFGGCVDVFNVSILSGSAKTANAIGIFNDNTNTLGLDSGMLITNGDAMLAIGPNNSASAGSMNNNPGDSLAGTLIPGCTTYDATVFEFDFIPLADTMLAFKFVFASEEYPEFVNAGYNDVFGFFISGPGYNGAENIAFVPGTNIPVSIDNVNIGMNSQYYINNTGGTTLQYDGFTTPIQIIAPVTPLLQYHFKVVVADAGDGVYDSGVFIQAGSFAGVAAPPVAAFSYTTNENTVSFTNESVDAHEYQWNFGDGTSSTEQNPIHTYTSKSVYTASLNSANYCYNSDHQESISITATDIATVDNSGVAIYASEKPEQYNFSTKYAGVKTIEIYNIEGSKIQSQTTTDNSGLINLGSVANGIYLVKIISGENVYTKKIMK